MVWTRRYPDADTYIGPAQKFIMTFGSAILPPTEESVALAAVQTLERNGYKPLKVEVSTRGGFPYWEFDVNVYAYQTGVSLIPPLVLLGYIVLAIIALAGIYLIWLISQQVVALFWGPANGDVIPWGTIAIIAVVAVAGMLGYLFITRMYPAIEEKREERREYASY